MDFTDGELEELRSIWRKEFNEDISLDEALHHAGRLLELLLNFA